MPAPGQSQQRSSQTTPSPVIWKPWSSERVEQPLEERRGQETVPQMVALTGARETPIPANPMAGARGVGSAARALASGRKSWLLPQFSSLRRV